MAVTVNDRDTLISSETRKISITYPDDFSYEGDLIGSINGVDTTTVLSDLANSDSTVEILENSGTAIEVTSSALFTMPGGGAGGVFIGSGGLIGRDSGGTTKFTLSSGTGLLTVEDAIVNGTLTAGSVIANTVTIDGENALTVKNNANTGANHAVVSGSNPHNTPLSTISGDLDDIANGSTFFKTTGNEKTGAGRAFAALDSDDEYVKSLVSTKLTVVGGNPTTGWVGDADGIRMYQSGSLRVDIPVSGDPSFSGDITGGSNINITGEGVFEGSTTSGGLTSAIRANNSLNANHGVIGIAGGTTGAGVYGIANGSSKLGGRFEGQTSSATGAHILHVGTGTALKITAATGTGIDQQSGDCNLTNVTIDNKLVLTSQSVSSSTSVASTFSGGRPTGSGSSNTWVLIRANGNDYWVAGWAAT